LSALWSAGSRPDHAVNHGAAGRTALTRQTEPGLRPSRAVDLSRSAVGERLGGFIYGTILVLAVVVAGARAYPHGAGHVAALVAVTSVVFWIAHVYAHLLAEGVAKEERLSMSMLRQVAKRERGILEAAVPPVVALSLGAFGLYSARTAGWLALGLGLTVLVVQGFAFAHVERLGRVGTLLVVAANLGLGLALVALKLLVSH
jgi:hypothetical protein